MIEKDWKRRCISNKKVSWLFLIAVLIVTIIVVYNTYKEMKTGQMYFLFGYRPFVVLSESMEPAIMTGSIILAKEVTPETQLVVGDVITFHSEEFSENNRITVTHRICQIDDDKIYTKGDSNKEADGIALSMDNIDAKVVKVFNGPAWLITKLQSTAGKIVFVSTTAIIFIYYSRVSRLC